MTIIAMHRRRRAHADPFDADFDFAEQQTRARQRLTDEADAAFLTAKSNSELLAERAVEERIRALARTARLRSAQHANRHQQRRRRRERAAEAAHAAAVTAYHHAVSPHARLDRLVHGSQVVTRVLSGVAVVGVVWGAVNVQHNLMAGTEVADPRYWLAFAIEPMITLPILAIMHLATTASRQAHHIATSKIVAIETGLLALSLALNIAPHAIAGDIERTTEFAIAPLMIAAVVWLHSFASSEFAEMIANSPTSEHDLPRLAETIRPSQDPACDVA